MGRIQWDSLPISVQVMLTDLQVHMAQALPFVEGVQVTFDHLRSEEHPTVDTRP